MDALWNLEMPIEFRGFCIRKYFLNTGVSFEEIIIMKAAVRYYSRSGKTKEVAEYLAEAAGVETVSVDSKNAGLSEPADVLFIGGALYAYGLGKNLDSYLDSLDSTKVKKAVLFSTSWISKHALDLMRRKLTDKGIEVDEKTLYFKSREAAAGRQKAQAFAKQFL